MRYLASYFMYLNIGNLLLSVLAAYFLCTDDSTCIIPTLEMTCDCKLLQAGAVYVLSHVATTCVFLPYSLPNIIRMIKSRRMRWVGLVTRTGEKYIDVERPEGKGVGCRIVLNCILIG